MNPEPPVVPGLLPMPPLADGSVPSREPERSANLVRFQSELEFVQCLAHPMYLHELFRQQYFEQEEMLNYLKYLEYWRRPEYVKFIMYPTCLVYLTLLQQEFFRVKLGDMAFVQDLMRIGQTQHETWRIERVVKAEEAEADEDSAEEDTGLPNGAAGTPA